MSGREGVLDEPPLIETLDEPPIGNEACPQTSANPDAVVLGGIPLDDETLAPGERAETGTPSASSTHDPPSLNSDMEEFRNFMTQDTTTEEEDSRQWAIASPLEKVGGALEIIADVAVGVRLVHDSDRLFWLWCVALLTYVLLKYQLNDRYILPWLQRKLMELVVEYWRLSGTQARELSYQPTSWAVNVFGCSPTWRSWTRMLEHETDPLLIEIYTRRRSDDLSAQDTWYVVWVLSQYLVVCGALYYAISGRGLVWAIPSLVYFGVIIDFYLIALILRLHVRIRRYRHDYSQSGLDPL